MKRIALALLLLLMPAHAALAGLNRWTLTGPEGGSVRALVVSPSDENTLYASVTRSGVYKSSDGARTWRRLDLGTEADDLAIVPLTGNLFARRGNEVWRSDDAGEHWVPIVPEGFVASNERMVALGTTADAAMILILGSPKSRLMTFDDRREEWAAA